MRTEKFGRRSVWQEWPGDGIRAEKGTGKGGKGLLLAGWGVLWGGVAAQAALVTHQALPGLLGAAQVEVGCPICAELLCDMPMTYPPSSVIAGS